VAKYYQKFNKVLLPLDGSAFSETASLYASRLAMDREVELILFHVSTKTGRNSIKTGQYYLNQHAEAITALIETQTEPIKHKIRIKKKLVQGHPADEILGFIRNNAINLIVMATHGRSGISNFIMGSVAIRIVRESNIPVLLARPRESKDVTQDTNISRKVLIPMDGSKLGESVVPLVQTFISQFGDEQSEIILLSICEPSPIQSGHSVVVSEAAQAAAVNAFKYKIEANQYLSELARLVRNDGFNVSTKLVKGNPAEKIIEQARENGVNLIAMTTHGRSGITKMAYGSVAEAVIHRTITPILLLRPSQ